MGPFRSMALDLVPQIKRIMHDLRQKQNSKKGSKKSKSASKEQADDSFPESNSAVKKGFSYSVMGIGVQYKAREHERDYYIARESASAVRWTSCMNMLQLVMLVRT